MTPDTKITQRDLKFFPSERLTDNDDGGGMPLGTPIKGEANEIFNPISSIARVNGAFNARLVYAGVQRPDDEPLIGAHVALTRPPDDPSVSYLLFPATKFGETREEILQRIEAYSVGTIESRMTLLSTQSQNSKVIQAYQRVGEPLPLVGDVYCLRQDKAGYPWHEQYVQVVKVDSEDRTFTGRGDKEFTRTVIKMEISGKLETDFIGVDYPVEDYADAPCKIRETHVADAAQYYGIKPLAEAIMRESATLKIPSLMEKLVPTNQIEQPMTDLTAGGRRPLLFDASAEGDAGVLRQTINQSHSAGATTTLTLSNPAMPNTVAIDTDAGQVVDTGNLLTRDGEAVGSIDHATGKLTFDGVGFSAYLRHVDFRAAGSEQSVSDTYRIPVTINSRSYSDAITLDPAPSVGSLVVSYRAGGRWYDLYDDGTGTLRGASAAHGSGSINYATGTISTSYGELPDIGSSILFSWATRGRHFNRAGSPAIAQMVLQLSDEVVASSLSLSWTVDGTNYTAVSDAMGNITGDWTGIYDAKTRQIRIDTDAGFNHPDGVLDIEVSYSTGTATQITKTLSAPDANGMVTDTFTNVLPGTFALDVTYTPAGAQANKIYDDGLGKLYNMHDDEVGTIDYDTGEATFDTKVVQRIKRAVYQPLSTPAWSSAVGSVGSSGGITYIRQILSHYEYTDTSLQITEPTTVNCRYYSALSADTVQTSLPSGNIEIDLLPNFSETVTAGSVNVTWGGKRYNDRSGTVVTDHDIKTGAATNAGTIDYATAKMTLTNWTWKNGDAPVVHALATSINVNPVDAVTFRAPASPLRAGSLQVRATALDGTKLSAIADYSGELNANGVQGSVDVEYGVSDVQFGRWVTAAGFEDADWYNPDAVRDDGTIWQPLHVIAESITYNTVAYSYLPIDSNIVKIDTVRLPQDGRIPIFRRGDNIMIGNRQTEDIGSAHTGGQTVQLSRGDVDRICVTDANGTPVNAELWDYDLDAGTITWASPLDLSAYVMPLSVMHAQEERNSIVEMDIDGTLKVRFAIKRDYPIEGTFVSSLLLGGDLAVRHSVPFTQRHWDNVWQDEPQGDELLNKLNLRDYPMVLTDDGAITERWVIKMTGTSQFELYGETLGFVMRDDTLTDVAPTNPATGKPYFTIPKEAFGNDAPWAAQDVIRFNTWGTLLPVWVLCAVQPSPNAWQGEDGFTMCLFGDTTEV